MNRYGRRALICFALAMISTGCAEKVNQEPETDAEIYCREAGFDIGSDAYAECLRNWSENPDKPQMTQ